MMGISLNIYSIYIDASNLLTIFIIFLLYKKKIYHNVWLSNAREKIISTNYNVRVRV